jgi:putative transposase
MSQFNSEIRHRLSIRLKGYDYSQPGAYFITLVTFHRHELFGKIVNARMHLSVIGQIAHDEWLRTAGIRREIRLFEDEFVIMPNHLHGIVWIVDIVGADGIHPMDNVHPVGADGVRPCISPIVHQISNNVVQGANLAPLHRKPKSLSSFVAGFKSAVTSRAGRELNLSGIWQRNYYDHIIRNDYDLIKIWEYIDTNPQKWQDDQLHPSDFINSTNQE